MHFFCYFAVFNLHTKFNFHALLLLRIPFSPPSPRPASRGNDVDDIFKDQKQKRRANSKKIYRQNPGDLLDSDGIENPPLQVDEGVFQPPGSENVHQAVLDELHYTKKQKKIFKDSAKFFKDFAHHLIILTRN